MTPLRPGEVITPGVARLPLTQGYFVMIDESDLELMGRFNWRIVKIRKTLVYAARGELRNGKVKTVYMHREISGAGHGQVTDHRNGNTLDNRRSNLRVCTSRENSQNRKAVVAACGFKCVHLMFGRWYAYIEVSGKRIWLGNYDSAEEAARAYDAAAILHFGKFAATNLELGRYGSPA